MNKGNFITVLDLGSSSVAMVVASKGEDGKLHLEDSIIAPSEGVVEGEIRNIEQVAKSITAAIRKLEERLSVKIAEVYTGISGRHVRYASNTYYVYIGRDGEICREDVQRLVESMNNVQAPEGCRILHMSAQSYLVNDREEVADPVGMFGNKLDGVFNFIIAENEHLSRLERALQRVGLRSRGVLVNALATAMAVTYRDERDLGVAVVDLGAGTTDVCIFAGGTLRYAGVIPLGVDLINKDLRSYGILERYVEELKVNYGSAVIDETEPQKRIKIPGYTPGKPQEITFRALSEIIDARLKDIAKYVMDEIRYSGYEGKLAAGLVLTGGGAGLKDIDKFFGAETKMEVRVASAEVSVDEASVEVASDYRLSTAIGLALQGFEGDGATAHAVKESVAGGESRNVADTNAGADSRSDSKPDGSKKPRRGSVQPPPEEDVEEQPDDSTKKEGSIFRRIRKMFEVIEDNEI